MKLVTVAALTATALLWATQNFAATLGAISNHEAGLFYYTTHPTSGIKIHPSQPIAADIVCQALHSGKDCTGFFMV